VTPEAFAAALARAFEAAGDPTSAKGDDGLSWITVVSKTQVQSMEAASRIMEQKVAAETARKEIEDQAKIAKWEEEIAKFEAEERAEEEAAERARMQEGQAAAERAAEEQARVAALETEKETELARIREGQAAARRAAEDAEMKDSLEVAAWKAEEKKQEDMREAIRKEKQEEKTAEARKLEDAEKSRIRKGQEEAKKAVEEAERKDKKKNARRRKKEAAKRALEDAKSKAAEDKANQEAEILAANLALFDHQAMHMVPRSRAHDRGGEDVLFLIHRSNNRNCIIYKGDPDIGVDVHWIMFEKKGEPTEGLTVSEKKAAYGYGVRQKGMENWLLMINAVPDRKIFVSNAGGEWAARTRINGVENVRLYAIHMQMKVNRGDMPTSRAFVRMASVDYIEIFGADFSYEKIEIFGA
jgi:hypothetical protein